MLINLILEIEEKKVKKRNIWLYGKFQSQVKKRKSKENQTEQEE